jgi:hypothetical protein
MNFPLALLHIPALVVYLGSENALKDRFTRRQNACTVLEEFIDCSQKDPYATSSLKEAVEKCRGSVKCPASFVVKTLQALHDALCKKTPPMTRPVTDSKDTCDLEAWNEERSFVREVFGTQIQHQHNFSLVHLLTIELQNTGNSLAKCLRDTLDGFQVKRAPLILVITKNPKKFIDYPFEFDFADVKYVLKGVTTSETSYYEKEKVWYKNAEKLEHMNDLVTKDAYVIVYYRK